MSLSVGKQLRTGYADVPSALSLCMRTGRPRTQYIQKYKNMKLSLVFLLCAGITFAQSPIHWRIIETDYFSEDVCVAALTDTDHPQIDKTGTTDSQAGIQALLDLLGQAGGGTLYLSEGIYKVEGQLLIPHGVVLRGDWNQPQKDKPTEGTMLRGDWNQPQKDKPTEGTMRMQNTGNTDRPRTISGTTGGTILMAYAGRGSEDETNAFITMEPATGLYNMTIWYPEQLPDNITPYPPSVLYGRRGYWGNDYCNVRNVTFVNAYTGVAVSRLNGGGCPNIFNVYGTPLSRGIEIDNIADVGRIDWVDFSPDYWATSGLPDAPAKDGPHCRYLLENATGVVMRRNDWSYTCHLSLEGYHTGFYAGLSMVAGDMSKPNGHNYHFMIRDCMEAIRLDGVSGAGIMFTKIDIAGCDYGIVVGNGVESTAQFYDCAIAAKQDAIKISDEASLKLLSQQCTIHAGKVHIGGGLYVSVDSDFDNEPPQVSTGLGARLLFTGNRFSQQMEINDRSLFESYFDHQPVSIKPLPAFPDMKPRETKPARNALYVVTDLTFGGKADAVTDNTEAIQKALDKAGEEGGGIVFLPPGKYRVDGTLSVPEGVEIKGASDVASVPEGEGSIIEIYAGKNDPNGIPFLLLAGKSGIRGITFNYPEQRSSMTINPATLPEYPYCIRATGPDVYIVNVGVRAMSRGIDLFTHRCDNHYVDYLAGHVFKNAIRIGSGSSNGIVSNLQFNSIVMSNGYEYPKFGGWPNSDNDESSKNAVYNQNWEELEFMILEDCKNQILYNNFHYASHKGLILGSNGASPSGISMGLGLDASLRSICYEGIDPDNGFDLINSQVVSIARNVYADSRFIETSPAFTGEAFLYSADFWGNARYGGVYGSGTVNLIMPHFEQYGTERFLHITGDAVVNLSTADVNATNFVTSGKAGQVSVESSVVALNAPQGYHEWRNNIHTSPVIRPETLLPRTGWIASAGDNNNTAYYAIDGIPTTRWTTGGSQRDGQWFSVDLRQPITFNALLLDASLSPNDGPDAYAVYISVDGTSWGDAVAVGAQSTSLLLIRLPETTARYIKIVQTGNGKTNYWSIHEFYLANVSDVVDVSEPSIPDLNDSPYPYLIHSTLYFGRPEQIAANAIIHIFDISGRLVLTTAYRPNGISLEHIPPGIYLLTLQHKTWKLLLRGQGR